MKKRIKLNWIAMALFFMLVCFSAWVYSSIEKLVSMNKIHRATFFFFKEYDMAFMIYIFR